MIWWYPLRQLFIKLKWLTWFLLSLEIPYKRVIYQILNKISQEMMSSVCSYTRNEKIKDDSFLYNRSIFQCYGIFCSYNVIPTKLLFPFQTFCTIRHNKVYHIHYMLLHISQYTSCKAQSLHITHTYRIKCAVCL